MKQIIGFPRCCFAAQEVRKSEGQAGGVGRWEGLLTPFEKEVAALARAGYSRSQIAAALGIASGTVKAVLRDIRGKLGPDWRERAPLRRSADEALAGGKAVAGRAVAALRAGVPPSGDGSAAAGPKARSQAGANAAAARHDREAQDGRRVAASLLLRSRGRTLLKVSGAQRFFLRPVLAALESERHVRLLAADRHELFAPPWLPVVNRGRRAVRAAVYLVRDEAKVRAALEDYLRSGLHTYVGALIEQVAPARNLTRPWRRAQLPDEPELWTLLREAFHLS